MKKQILLTLFGTAVVMGQIPALPISATTSTVISHEIESSRSGVTIEGSTSEGISKNLKQGVIGENCNYTLDAEGNMVISGTGVLSRVPSD